MSLVNDVLRQLDTGSSKPYPSMPLHSLMADEPVRNNKFASALFVALVALLLIILTLQLFYKQSLVNVFYAGDQPVLELPAKLLALNNQLSDIGIKPNSILMPATNSLSDGIFETVVDDGILEIKGIKDSQILKDERSVLNAPVSAIAISAMKIPELKASEIKVSDMKYSEIKSSEIKSPEIKSPEIKSIAKKISEIKISKNEGAVKKEASVRKEEYQLADIKAVKNLGFKQYQLALKAYKQQQNSVALSWIDLALGAEKKDEYLRLKVRILMQKGEGDELHRFVLAQSDNTNLAWFQLVAPSLQMYAYYDLSNKYYAELVKQQPNEVKWQLAMALNFSKQEFNDKTISIYKNLLNSSLLTYKQQKWITSRLKRMDQSRIVIND